MIDCRAFVAALLVALGLLQGGCPKAPSPTPTASLLKLRLQTDWFPQAEHGGFYQALARGYYAEEGLEVEILPGGPGASVPQKLVAGIADIGMVRSDDVITFAARGLPLVYIGSFMQHDPQAVLVHDESPVRGFADLQGRTVMAIPGTNWVRYIQLRYGIDFALIPMNFGLAQFMANKEFIQQAFITNEPFYVRRNGGNPRTLLIAEAGYDPYRGLMVTRERLEQQPEALRRFLRASIRGWRDYMTQDPSAGDGLILQRNPNMDAEFLSFSRGAMADHRLILGHAEKDEDIGHVAEDRLTAMSVLLAELGIIPRVLELDEFAALHLLSPDLIEASKRPRAQP